MGCKYFCDRCGDEIEKNGSAILINAYDGLGNVLLSGIGRKFLCEKCTKKFDMIRDRLEHAEDFFDMTDNDIALMEYDFKVGDTVITSTGNAGTIRSICYCDRCKERGFYEPKVEVTDGGDDAIWITDTDKRNGFISFYQIGKYKFGNIDKESVKRSIENENNNIKEACKRLEEYENRLRRLKRLEHCEEDEEEEEENSSEEDSWLDYLL